MSKRVRRWIDVWIEDNVRPGDGADIESHHRRARRFAGQLLAEAAAGGFGKTEIDEEAGEVEALILRRLSTAEEFDLSGFGAAPPDD